MLKRASRLAPAIRNAKQAIVPSCMTLTRSSCGKHGGKHVEAPHPGEQRGSDAERDHVGKRVEFPAEIAFCVGHAGDAAIEAVEKNREPDGHGSEIEMPGLGQALPRVRLEDREESGCDVGGGK